MRRSVWLMPRAIDALALSATIERLARDYARPSFPPHVTVVGSTSLDDQQAELTLARLAARTPKLRVRLAAPAWSQAVFQTVYVTLEPTAALLGIAQDIRVSLDLPDSPTGPQPHLSLLYGGMSEPESRRLCASLALPDVVELDELMLVGHSGGGSLRAEVNGWTPLRRFHLRGK